MSIARVRLLFRVAAIYGFVVLVPYLFMETRVGLDFPPPITHPEFFYGFAGVALAWQVAFLLIASDPVRFRPIIIAGILEKLAWSTTSVALVALGRGHPLLLLGGGIDLAFAVAFAIAFHSLGAPAQDAR